MTFKLIKMKEFKFLICLKYIINFSVQKFQSCCLIFLKLVNLTGLKAVEHLAIVILFLEIASVM